MNWIKRIFGKKVETKQCDIHVVIERLERLKKWHLQAGCGWNAGVLEQDVDEDGDWIKVEDVENLIKDIKANVL